SPPRRRPPRPGSPWRGPSARSATASVSSRIETTETRREPQPRLNNSVGWLLRGFSVLLELGLGGRRRRRVAAALPDSSALADLAAQVVETALAYIAVPQHVDLVDPRRVHEEGALHADPVGHAPHREVLAQSSACDPDHRAFEDLYALARALDDLGVN